MKIKVDPKVFNCSYEGKFEFPSQTSAIAVSEALSADPEVRPDESKRIIYAHNGYVIIEMHSKGPKVMRNSLNSLFRSLMLSAQVCDILYNM